MEYFPLFVKLKEQPCLVVGAGEIAARKIELLSRAGAKITVVAEQIGKTVRAMEQAGVLTRMGEIQYQPIIEKTRAELARLAPLVRA